MNLVSIALRGKGLNGSLYLKLKEYSLHEQVRAVKENPNETAAWLELVQRVRTIAMKYANIKREEEWYREAMRVYDRALELNPGNLTLQMEKDSFINFTEVMGYKFNNK